MRASAASKILIDAFSQQASMLAMRDQKSPEVKKIVKAMGTRLELAERALHRADPINLDGGGTKLAQLFRIIRANLDKQELNAWDRLAQVIRQELGDL